MTERFDRKTFDPVSNPTHSRTLSHLRAPGRFRRHQGSPAYRNGLSVHESRGGHFLDIGCGDSWDYTFARDAGYRQTTRIDLFRPWIFLGDEYWSKYGDRHVKGFIQADAAESIPLPNDSVDLAIAQAMYDLVEPDARDRFHSEVCRVMKPGGVFALHYVKLSAGWGWDTAEEHERLLRFWMPDRITKQGFVVVKSEAALCLPDCAEHRHCDKCRVLITRRNQWARSGRMDLCMSCCQFRIGERNVAGYLNKNRSGPSLIDVGIAAAG